MKILKSVTVLISAVLILNGCPTTGYMVTTKTNQLNYSVIKEIESTLQSQGFKIIFHEKETVLSDVLTAFSKKINDKKGGWVEAFIRYNIGDNREIVKNVEVKVSNIAIGFIDPEIKNEIEKVGKYYYEYLSKIVGKENVTFVNEKRGPIH